MLDRIRRLLAQPASPQVLVLALGVIVVVTVVVLLLSTGGSDENRAAPAPPTVSALPAFDLAAARQTGGQFLEQYLRAQAGQLTDAGQRRVSRLASAEVSDAVRLVNQDARDTTDQSPQGQRILTSTVRTVQGQVVLTVDIEGPFGTFRTRMRLTPPAGPERTWRVERILDTEQLELTDTPTAPADAQAGRSVTVRPA